MPTLLVAVPAAWPQTTVEFTTLTGGVLEQRLRLAHPDVPVRYQRLKQLFADAGCTQLREQPVPKSQEPNLLCATAGEAGSRRILVGAHYDSAGGDGVIDNWTGAILMPSLWRFVNGKPRRHSFEFIGFAAEERGLLGSRAYLRALPKEERAQIAAVITLDSLGLSPTKYWPSNSSKTLAGMAAALAEAMQLRFIGIDADAIGRSDSFVFHQAGIPVLSLHSVTQQTWTVINSKRDVWESLQWNDYYDTHRFVSALLVYLDQKLP